ncbi:MAG: serine hydrolase domain-containing protein, partial [Sphingomicrobium sp.]
MRTLLLAFTLLLVGAPADARDSDGMSGIWRGDANLGPKLHGSLVVRRIAGGYAASIGGERATSRGGEIRLIFGRDGGFRGRIHGRFLQGFWIQPSGDVQNGGDPGGSGQSYATPVRLVQVSPGVWRGNVRPLSNRFTLWLSIFEGGDGSLTAAFRNPEMNSMGSASRFDVSRNGHTILFSARTGDRAVTHSATLLGNPDRIRIDWPDAGRTVELTRRSGADAAAFFPRPPGSAAYVYRRPPELADGWRTARASAVGIAETVLEVVIRNVAASDPTARPPQLMHSILVAHGGRLVLEEYFYGFGRASPHDMRSAAKTFGSVLLGTAAARATGLSADSRIYDVMRSLGPFANPDPRKDQITLAHLMTHTSGLACNDNGDNSPGNEMTMQSQAAEPNWWRYTLNLPQQFAPGTRYAYCSANSNLVGGALTQTTGTWIPELFEKTIAEPLQFGEWHWNLMPNGEGYLGGGAFLLPRDLLKVGQTYLDGGVWNGRRIIPAEWVKRSTQAAVEVSPETTGLSEDEFSNFYLRAEDGLAWHLNILKSGGRSYRTYGATGNGGQLLIVVPDADLAVVFTGGN